MDEKVCGIFRLVAITLTTRGDQTAQREFLIRHYLQMKGLDGDCGVRGMVDEPDRAYIIEDGVAETSKIKLRIIGTGCSDPTFLEVVSLKAFSPQLNDAVITDGHNLNGVVRYRSRVYSEIPAPIAVKPKTLPPEALMNIKTSTVDARQAFVYPGKVLAEKIDLVSVAKKLGQTPAANEKRTKIAAARANEDNPDSGINGLKMVLTYAEKGLLRLEKMDESEIASIRLGNLDGKSPTKKVEEIIARWQGVLAKIS